MGIFNMTVIDELVILLFTVLACLVYVIGYAIFDKVVDYISNNHKKGGEK